MVTPQLVFNGLVNGLVYRAARDGDGARLPVDAVINFAVGEHRASSGPALLASLVLDYGVPYGVALAGGLVCGTAFAAVVELIVDAAAVHARRG